jgi:DNA-directed RNA polymerase subunit alpha
MHWNDFQRPRRLEIDAETLTPSYGRFTAQPFERGFATTVGNALRRCLLSSIEGAAITAVQIDGVLHEFSSIPGIKEDATDIVLNLKQVPVRLLVEGPRVLSIDVKGPREVKAADLAGDPQIEIVDPEAHIASVNEEGHLRMDVQIKHGRGYVSTDKNFDESLGIGWVALDSVHSPVKRVNYRVETARVGRVTDYEKLTIEVWTNGTIGPEEALSLASTLFGEHLSIFITSDEVEGVEVAGNGETSEIDAMLAKSLDDFDLSVRTANCLKNASIGTVRDLVSRSENEILEIKNFGRKSLEELQDLLGQLGLSFGMEVDGGAEAGV